MTDPVNLRTFAEFSHFCGCGDSSHCDEFYRVATRLLRDFDRDRKGFVDANIIASFSDRMVAEFLSRDELIEHGGSIGGSWLTETGKELLELIRNGEIWTNPSEIERDPIDSEITRIANE